MLKGIGVSEGIGIGNALVIESHDIKFDSYAIRSVNEELERYHKVVEKFIMRTKEMANNIATNASEKEAEILFGHIIMVKDPYMQGEIESLIKSGQCVEYAVSKICDSFISMFSSVDDELTNQRATDVLDIKNSLLAILLNIEEINLKDAPPETVVVADVLTPSMTSGINSENIVGIITENGGATSHSSIIARALGIPAVLSVDNALQNIKNGNTVIVDGNNEVTELMAYALGLKDQSQFTMNLMNALAGGEKLESGEAERISYDDILGLRFKMLTNSDLMHKDEKTGLWSDMRNNAIYVSNELKDAVDVKVVGIVRPGEDNVLSVGTGYIGYTGELMDYALKRTRESEVVKEQLKNPKKDVITGMEFFDKTVNDFDLADIDLNEIDFNKLNITPFLSMAKDMDLSQIDITDMSSMFNFGDMSDLQKKLMEGYLTDDQVLAFKQAYIDTVNSKCSLEKTYETIGYSDEGNPTSISLYPKDFDTKAEVNDMVDFYNKSVTDDGHEELTINCTDYIGIAMNIATQAINIVTYTLVIFVAISLVVSSIMIGIITYVSVIERTKEIGILRSIGASKRDVSNVFNAETFIIGLSAGLIGIGVTLLCEIPINLLLRHLTGAPISAILPFTDGLALVCVSVFLTFIAGLIPSSLAAKKDPVEALRTE